jgi:hypothetical protein
MEFNYNCPSHGVIPAENQVICAGGKFCGVLLEEIDALCMEPLDIKPLETNTDGDLSK